MNGPFDANSASCPHLLRRGRLYRPNTARRPSADLAAIDLSADEAGALVAGIKAKSRIQAHELKSKLLRRRDNWLAIALDIVERAAGRSIVIATDKRLNLGGKAVEYLFAPVLQDKNGLARRADKGEYPLEDIEDFYAAEFRRPAPGQRSLKRLLAAFARGQR